MQRKLLAIISVDFDATGQMLIIYVTVTHTLESYSKPLTKKLLAALKQFQQLISLTENKNLRTLFVFCAIIKISELPSRQLGKKPQQQ
jgi:hypothetical protein